MAEKCDEFDFTLYNETTYTSLPDVPDSTHRHNCEVGDTVKIQKRDGVKPKSSFLLYEIVIIGDFGNLHVCNRK